MVDTQSQLQPAQSLRGTEPEATVDRPGDWRGTFLQSFHAIAIVTILIFISIQLPITIAGSQSLPSSQETGTSSLSPVSFLDQKKLVRHQKKLVRLGKA